MKLKPDKPLRDRLFTRESLAHPAKAHLGMMLEIIRLYTEPGQVILDPMAGIGGTLVAALSGRHIICVELEGHFLLAMVRSWAKMRQNGPMLGYEMGQVLMLQGDARCLPIGSCDAIVTSPPYETVVPFSDRDWLNKHRRELGGGGWVNTFESYTMPAAIITSPPYSGEGLGHSQAEGPNAGSREGEAQKFRGSYTEPLVDVVITSPPYGEAKSGGGIAKKGYVKPDQKGKIGGGKRDPVEKRGYMRGNVGGSQNIGALKAKDYFGAMTEVYQECHRVLAQNGIMVLIVKGMVTKKVYIDLPGQTKALVESLGFRLFDEWQRELWALGFWRNLHRRNSPDSWDKRLRFETVMAFRKEQYEGMGT